MSILYTRSRAIRSLTLAILLSLSGCNFSTVFKQSFHETRIQLLVNEGDDQEAIQYYERVRNDVELSSNLCYLLTQAYYGMDDYERCLEFARKTLELDPTVEYAARFFASAAKRAGDPEESIAFLEDLIPKNPQWAMAHKDFAILLGYFDYNRRAYEVAKEGHERLPSEPRLASIYFYYAFIELPYEDIRVEFESWIGEYVADAYFWSQVGKGLSEAGHSEEALPYLIRALEEGSDDENTVSEALDCYRALGDFAGAKEFAKDYAWDETKGDVLWNMLGAISYDTEHYDEALRNFDIALRLASDSAKYAANKLYTLHALSRSQEGIEFGEEWLERQRGEPTAAFHHSLGHCYFGRSQFDNALSAYQKALSLNPGRTNYARDIVSTYRRLNRSSEGIEFGERWKRDHPNQEDDSFLAELENARSDIVAN